MKGAVLSLRVLRGAIFGALISIVTGFVVLTVFGILFYGPSGLLLGLYFGGGLILFVGPLGMVVGAGVAIVRILKGLSRGKIENGAQHSRIAYAIWIAVPLLVIVGLAVIPYRVTNVNREVSHGAIWTTEDRPDCAPPAVILMLVKYPVYEIVCSAELLHYLQSQADAVVPITYRVTYDFGEPRSYQLINVGPTSITWTEWLGGPSGCGGKYLPSCNSPQAQNGSPLYESSWSGS